MISHSLCVLHRQVCSAVRRIAPAALWRFTVACAGFILLLCGASRSDAQEFDAQLEISSASPSSVRVSGHRAVGATAWSFRNAYAGVLGLGNRIEDLKLSGSGDETIPVQRLAPGEYRSERPATRFDYTVRLDVPAEATAAAHVSWLTAERGMLILGDVLPQSDAGALAAGGDRTLELVVPAGWTIATTEARDPDGRFRIADLSHAVFCIGRDLRLTRKRLPLMDLTLVSAGDWAFGDEDVLKLASDILETDAALIGHVPRAEVLVALWPFPRPAGPERWSAETSAGTVILLAGRMPSKTVGLARLSVPLTHELFHLWVPNGLGLEGDYDWFFEGFTMYQAMRTAMRLNLLTFQDYLGALGRAFDLSRQGDDHLSLVAASRRRWTDGNAAVYNRAMVLAFLYDLTLQQETRGKRSLEDVYRELFRLYSLPRKGDNANAIVISALGGFGAMRRFVGRYVEGPARIDLPAALAPFGLRVETAGARTAVTTAEPLSREQRDLLRKFGYNTETRAASGRSHGKR